MLYLSDIPFAELGFPVDLPHTAPPEETEKIMTKLPAVIAGVTVLMAGTVMVTHRNKPAQTVEKNSNKQEEQS
jgi:hypothetical protein